MKYETYSPLQELRSIVKNYVVVYSFENIENLLFLPDGGSFIIFNRGVSASAKLYGVDEAFPIPKNYSISLKTNRVNRIVLDSGYVHSEELLPIIMVELLPTGSYKLFNTDMSTTDFKYQEIEKEVVERYFSKLYTNGSIEEELKYIDSSLSELRNTQDTASLFTVDIIEKIYDDYNFELTIDNILKEYGCSQSTLERHFKKILGLTPKNFMFTLKFCMTLLEYVDSKKTFHEIQYIYSDNSHMNAVFQKFLGIAPSEMMKKVANEELYIYQLQNLKNDSANANKAINPSDILEYSRDVNCLYVEDNEIMRSVMSDLLKNYFKNLAVANDGKEGLEMYTSGYENGTAYDLIITDINMPKMDGLEMSREILKINDSQLIIITSAFNGQSTKAKDLGVREILIKPIDYKELSRCLFEISKEIHDRKSAVVLQ